jgi:hypothetical protein
VTDTENVVDMAEYGALLATETLTLQVPAVEGATSRPETMRHFPAVTRYVRVPFETVPTIRASDVRDDLFTFVTYTTNPGRADTVMVDDDTAPAEFFVAIVNT